MSSVRTPLDNAWPAATISGSQIRGAIMAKQVPILGAHEPFAGGYYKAVEIAARVECACTQVFTITRDQ